MKKGISLAIESIIILILAVSVLSVLMIIFRGKSSELETETDLIIEKNKLCSQYVQFAGADACTGKNLDKFNKKNDLISVCLKNGNCVTDDQSLECIKKCCRMFMSCPA